MIEFDPPKKAGAATGLCVIKIGFVVCYSFLLHVIRVSIFTDCVVKMHMHAWSPASLKSFIDGRYTFIKQAVSRDSSKNCWLLTKKPKNYQTPILGVNQADWKHKGNRTRLRKKKPLPKGASRLALLISTSIRNSYASCGRIRLSVKLYDFMGAQLLFECILRQSSSKDVFYIRQTR